MNASVYQKAQYGYGVITEFFDAWSLPTAKKYLKKILEDAMSTKPTKINPSTVLYFFKTLGGLTGAALIIAKNKAYREEAIVKLNEDGFPDLLNHRDYVGRHEPAHQWLYFPRALSVKEFADPYRVFKKLARYADEEEWRSLFEELQDFCFYKTSFAECGEEYNILRVSGLLHKLVEAAHLIQVRVRS